MCAQDLMEHAPMFKLVRAVCLAVLIVAAFVAVPPLPGSNAVQTKPNIIVIMTDDMRADDLNGMPDTRDIIGTANGLGANYENAIDGVPLCCPARVSFLTGQYPHNHGVGSNLEEQGGGWQAWNEYTEQTASLPIWLDAAGYRTEMFGKYVNEYGHPALDNPDTFVPNGWDNWIAMVHGAGYDGFDTNENGTVVSHPNPYSTTWITDRATASLDQRLPSDTPLFQWISYFAPHDGAQTSNTACHVPAEAQYAGTSNPGLPTGTSFNEANVSDKPAWIQALSQFTQSEKDDIAECRGDRRDALKSVDDAVLEIRNELVEAGELNNTYLVFISDNGFQLGEHRIKAAKQWPYEESAGIPLLVRGPTIPAGTKTRAISNVDVTASIVGWAGATATLPLDGQPVEVAPGPGVRRAVVVSRTEHNNQINPPLFAGLRVAPTATYPALAYFDYETGLDELYGDYGQTVNKISDPAYATVKTTLQAALAELDDCAGFQTPASASTTDCNVEVNTLP